MERIHNFSSIALYPRFQAPIDRFDLALRWHERPRPRRPLRVESLGADLVEGHARTPARAHAIRSFHQHAVVSLQVVERGDRAVSGNDFRVRGKLVEERGDVLRQGLDVAAVL